jgi:LysR family transcriptional activator of nhaA
MEWLNYHHLLYFWMVARTGTIARASEELRLAQPTISGQIRTLEQRLGEKLFRRSGRRLVLTDVGQVVYEYADEIFGLGQELLETLQGRPTGRPMRLTVGISSALPKTLVHHLLEPALHLDPPPVLICRVDKTDQLLAELSIQRFDLVLSDEPVSGPIRVKAFNHVLGTSRTTIFGTPDLVRTYRPGFPGSLSGAPFLLPTVNTLLRRGLDRWFEHERIRVRTVAEFEDSALLKHFGARGEGLFAAATALEEDLLRDHDVQVVGRTDQVEDTFYAITIERRIKHPAVQAIVDASRAHVFAERSPSAEDASGAA